MSPASCNNTLRAALQAAVAQLHPRVTRPRLEAELLLAHLLDVPRTAILAHPEAELTPSQARAYAAHVGRRAAGEPLPYITGTIEFFGLAFHVTPAVLIPRPETECLVTAALTWVRAHPGAVAVDVGTGSGCIAVTLAVHAPELRLCAIDNARAALAVAQVNAQRHGVAHALAFVEADLLTPFPRSPAGRLDLIVSNPPYVAQHEWAALPPSVRQEPRAALLAGPEGLDALRRLLAQAPGRLRAGGRLLVEIGASQGDAARALAQAAFFDRRVRVQILPDLAGRDRVLQVDV